MSKRQSTRFFLFCSVAGALMLSVTASADEPVKSAPAASSCRKPELADRPRVTAQEIERTAVAVEDYVDCMRPVLEAQRKDAEAQFAEAKATAEASNAAATEVNALVDAYKKWAAEHQGDEGS